MEAQNLNAQAALSDGLHQLKNPLQALRTYGKILQMRIADTGSEPGMGVLTPQLLELTDHLMVQSDRLADRLKPVDFIVDNMAGSKRLPSLNPANPPVGNSSLAQTQQALLLPWEGDTLAFARGMTESGVGEKESDSLTQAGGREDNEPQDFSANEQAVSSYSPLFEGLELEMTFVDNVLEPILSAFQAIAADKGVEFVIDISDELPGVTVSPQAVQEAISNILDNAFKYVKLGQNPVPTVCIRLLPNKAPRDPGVTVLVQDTGPGIRPEDHDVVFERGYRSPTISNIVDGSGIGLDIARSLVERTGGTLRVRESQTDSTSSGTTMELVLYRNPRLD